MIAIAFLGAVNPTIWTYPEADVVEAFRSVCVLQQSEQEILNAANRDGWEPVDPAPHSTFGQIVALQRTANTKPGTTSSVRSFLRGIRGTNLALMVIRVSPSGQRSSRVNCVVYDFLAKKRLSDSAIDRLSTQPATKSHVSSDIWFRQWDSADAAQSLRVSFVPQASSVEQGVGIVGTALQASYNSENK